MNKEEMWELLIDYEIATDEEIKLVTNINGYSKRALTDIIEVRTGLDFDQYKEYELN
tara:strand:+ start:524 stop:694 length:171 start_codon:yes stop_codon:yes gene_type:complete